MSEGPKSILVTRVTNIRARLVGNMLILLSLLFVVGILYGISLSRLDRAVVVLEETVAQTDVLTSEQQAAALAETKAARRAMLQVPLAWGLLIAIAVVAVTAITIHSIVQPAERFTEAAEHLARGELEKRVDIEWADEFGRLGVAFNEMADQLQTSYAALEQRVLERTEALEWRSTQLEAAAQVAQGAAAIQDVEQLLEETVQLISDRFGFYHAGILLLEDEGGASGDYVVLRAASSEGGQRMLARGYRLPVGEQSLVGYVVERGESRIALDRGADAVVFDNPDLPDTRSEMVLPLQARGEIIGALDVQSAEPEAFSEDDMAALQMLADQVTVAINNARLFRRVQKSLEAERRAHGESSREAWRELLRTQAQLGACFDPRGILPAEGRWRDEMQAAVREERTVLDQDGRLDTLATPIKVRDQVIGVIDAYKPSEAGAWTQEEISLLETLTAQLGAALESARLYQDTQRRAAQERLVGEVTARMRETLDVDAVLQTAASEMREILNLAEAEIRIGVRRESGSERDAIQEGATS
jgi:GAF domain-containing protein